MINALIVAGGLVVGGFVGGGIGLWHGDRSDYGAFGMGAAIECMVGAGIGAGVGAIAAAAIFT